MKKYLPEMANIALTSANLFAYFGFEDEAQALISVAVLLLVAFTLPKR